MTEPMTEPMSDPGSPPPPPPPPTWLLVDGGHLGDWTWSALERWWYAHPEYPLVEQECVRVTGLPHLCFVSIPPALMPDMHQWLAVERHARLVPVPGLTLNGGPVLVATQQARSIPPAHHAAPPVSSGEGLLDQ